MKATYGNTAYDEVEKIVLEKYGDTGDSILVQMRLKYDGDDEWEECTELLLNEGPDWTTPKYVWENDWWEGQEHIEVIAMAPVYAIDLGDKWKLEGIQP